MEHSRINSEELSKLIFYGENEKVEFKSHLADKEIIEKTISSIQNTLGGMIVFGVSETKEKEILTGLTNQEIKNLNDFCCGRHDVKDYYSVELDEKTAFVIEIEKSSRGVTYNGETYIRIKNRNVLEKEVNMQQLLERIEDQIKTNNELISSNLKYTESNKKLCEDVYELKIEIENEKSHSFIKTIASFLAGVFGDRLIGPVFESLLTFLYSLINKS